MAKAGLASELAEGERGLLPDVCARILQGSGEAVYCARVADLSEREGHLFPNVGIGILERDHERLYGT